MAGEPIKSEGYERKSYTLMGETRKELRKMFCDVVRPPRWGREGIKSVEPGFYTIHAIQYKHVKRSWARVQQNGSQNGAKKRQVHQPPNLLFTDHTPHVSCTACLLTEMSRDDQSASVSLNHENAEKELRKVNEGTVHVKPGQLR